MLTFISTTDYLKSSYNICYLYSNKNDKEHGIPTPALYLFALLVEQQFVKKVNFFKDG